MMACARCDFYLPKESSQAHLIEAKASITHMLHEVPLTDTEFSFYICDRAGYANDFYCNRAIKEVC